MRFGIIGAGVIGNVHARLIDSIPEARVGAVVDIIGERSETLANAYGARSYTDLDQVLVDPDIDALSICVPSSLHPDLAVRALEAGKSVLIEKPLGIDLAAARRVIEAEKNSSATAAVISQRRFAPPSEFIRAAIDEGQLGQLTSAVVESPFYRSQGYYDSGDWRGTKEMDGGGALMNQGIHALDLMIWMLGEPVRVSAHTGLVAHVGIEVEDVVGATITFANQAIGVLLATTSANPGLPVRLAVHGDKGVVVMDDERITRFESVTHTADPTTIPTDHEPVRQGWGAMDESHRAQYLDFIEAVLVGRPPRVTIADGYRSLAVVLAVYESARLGRAIDL